MNILIYIASTVAVLLIVILLLGVFVISRRQRLERKQGATGADRRRFTRAPIKISAEVAPDTGDIVEGCTSDLSVMGMYFQFAEGTPSAARDGLRKGLECRVALIIEGGNSPIRLNVHGVVMHKAEDGVGMEFIKMSQETFDNLRYVICYNADNEDRIQSEIASHFNMKLD